MAIPGDSTFCRSIRSCRISAILTQHSGAIAVAAAACLWGLWGPIVRITGASGPAVAAIALVTTALAPIPWLPRRVIRDRRLWGALSLIGICDAANALLYFAAIERGPIAVAVLTHYLAPVIVAAITPMLLRSWPNGSTLVALPLALAGVGLLLGHEALELGDSLTTAALGAGSAVFYALNVVISKRVSDRLTPLEILSYHAAFSALLLLPVAWLSGGVALPTGIAIAGAALICAVGAGALFLWGLQRTAAPRASVLTYLEPLVGIVLSAMFLDERLTQTAPLGAVAIVAAGVLVLRPAPARVQSNVVLAQEKD